MTAIHNLGNYEITEDSNGDLLIKRQDDTVVFRYDSTNDKLLTANVPIDISELIDGAGVSHTGEIADQGDPGTHVTQHENNGSDELSVAGLSGLLADPQDPTAHSTQHEPGGSDEVTDIDINNTGTNASAHATRHEEGNADEVTVENLSTDSTDTSLAYKPDGAGGVQVASPTDLTVSSDDVTGSRSASTEYQNTTGNPLFVVITTNGGDGSDDIRIEAGSTSGSLSTWERHTPVSNTEYASLSIFIPDGYYYQLVAQGAISIFEWHEQELSA